MLSKRNIYITLLIGWIGVTNVGGQYGLSRTEIDNLLDRLTTRQLETWIPRGMIQVLHTRYHAPRTDDLQLVNEKVAQTQQAYLDNPDKPEQTEYLQSRRYEAIPFNVRYEMMNEWQMKTLEEYVVDGPAFFQDVEVLERTDSISPPDQTNPMYEHYRFDGNRKRQFAWDGQAWAMYTVPRHALIMDGPDAQGKAGGALSAGIVPWGKGLFSRANLQKCPISGRKLEINGRTEYELAITFSPTYSVLVRFCPDFDDSTTYFEEKTATRLHITTYLNYHQSSNFWLPGIIREETFIHTENKLTDWEEWEFIDVAVLEPDPAELQVTYDPDTFIEQILPCNTMVSYRNPAAANTDIQHLLSMKERLCQNESGGDNCGTIAAELVLNAFGAVLESEEKADLLMADNHQLSLYDLKNAIAAKGLHARAVQTTAETLADLADARIILHYPHQRHYVLLDRLDDEYAWIIDLTAKHIYRRIPRDDLQHFWADGIALIVTDTPSAAFTSLPEVDTALMQQITGGTGYTCTNLISSYNVMLCAPPDGDLCTGYYRLYHERYGCEEAPSGECYEQLLPRLTLWECTYDSPSATCIKGDFVAEYDMWACN